MGSKAKRKILLRSKHRVVYSESYHSHGKSTIAVNVVSCYPPKRWHLDYVSDEDDEAGEYVLKSLGARKTRIDLAFKEHFKTRDAPTKAQYSALVSRVWDKFAEALERDYKRSKVKK